MMDVSCHLIYKNNDELKDLMQCEEKLETLAETLPEMVALNSRRQQLAEENYAMANSNIQMKSDFEKNRDSTLSKAQELSSLQTKFESLTVEHQHLTEKFSPTNIQQLTLVAAAKSEEESEKIAEEFLDSKIDINSFLSTYMGKRIESHMRKFKADKLAAQLRELHKAGF